MKHRLFNYIRQYGERGATATEYAIMVAAIAIAIFSMLGVLGLKLYAIFESLIGKF